MTNGKLVGAHSRWWRGGVVAGVPVGRTQRPAPGVALSGAHQDWATEVGEGRWVCWWGAQNAVPAQRPLKRIVCC